MWLRTCSTFGFKQSTARIAFVLNDLCRSLAVESVMRLSHRSLKQACKAFATIIMITRQAHDIEEVIGILTGDTTSHLLLRLSSMRFAPCRRF